MARRRRSAEERAQERADRYGSIVQDRSWMRFTKCFTCRKRICVNNYADHKVRVSQWKVLGKVLCPTCKHGSGPEMVQLYLLSKKMLYMDHSAECQYPPTTKDCDVCLAMRIITKFEERRGLI